MNRTEEGGYDIWGVIFPNGKIREFSTLQKATTFADKMEGQTVVDTTGTWTTWTGLRVVHRFIPNWEEVAR